MKRIVIAVAASLVLAGGVGRAQTSPNPVVTFTTVDAVEAQSSKLVITGVKEGETAATTQQFLICSTPSTDVRCAALIENCDRLALLAMTKPGQYLLKIAPGNSIYYATCRLERVAP